MGREVGSQEFSIDGLMLGSVKAQKRQTCRKTGTLSHGSKHSLNV